MKGDGSASKSADDDKDDGEESGDDDDGEEDEVDVDEGTSKADKDVKRVKKSKKAQTQAAKKVKSEIRGGDDLVLHKYLIADEYGGLREDSVVGGSPFYAVESENVDYDFSVLKQ